MTVLSDSEARQRIATDTSSTLFVNAGAGSGKTRGLVERVRQLVLVDEIPLRQIAAVTFTEKAGAELRDRLRAEFDGVWRAAPESTAEHARADEALNDLDMSAIGTLHSFAQRILAAYPIEAGLPPLIEVLDEVGSSVAFDARWTQLQRELLDDDSMKDVLLQALSAGVKLEQLRSLARAFGYDWDLIDTHVLISEPTPAVLPDLSGFRARAEDIVAQRDLCQKPDDKFLPRIALMAELAANLGNATTDQQRFSSLAALDGVSYVRAGSQTSWPKGVLPALRDQFAALQEDAAQIVADYVDATLRPLAYWLAQRVRAAAYERAGEGKVEFHDLLVLGRNLLRTSGDARAGLQSQYRRILLDEFQDTDPIQVELAVRIAGGREATSDDWTDVDVPAGTLFFVGDPKQSIYRFRRANIRSYLQVSGWRNEPVTLSTNFRTVEPVIDWVNTVFSEVIREEEGRQPAYDPLGAHRTEVGTGPPVVLLGSAAHQDGPNASTIREREAADVAAIITRALDEQWTTEDSDSDAEGEPTWRPIRLRDIAVLLPARTSLPYLETALEEAGIAYRAESSSLVYEAPEVRELMSAVRAVVDPADQLACATALRSPLFGCTDLDLWQWKRARGSFNLLAPSDPARADLPVGQAMDYLRDLHYRSRWMTPSELLGALIADRRMLEFAATAHRRRDVWRRLRFVVDHARAWSETQHGGLRAYVAWATRQADEASRVAEAVLPEIDVDAVRVMTIHAAKGLEFPMVVLSGMTSATNNRAGVAVRWNERERGYAVRMSKRVQTNDFEAAQALDEQMDELEKRRLLYVAATRARDHLVVSLHHKPVGRTATKLTNAQLLVEAAGGTSVERFTAAAADARERVIEVADPPPDLLEWRARIERAQLRTRHESAQSASGLEGTEPAVQHDDAPAEGLAKGARDTDLPPWSKGRYGTAIGRAVHAVLQSVDLATGSDLDSHVETQCVAEGVTAYAELVRMLAQSALDSPIVRHAAMRRHWRESYAGKTLPDGSVLEGIIDLIYEDDDGTLVIVDYKTDDIPEAALPARKAFYAPQMTAYKDLIGSAVSPTAVRTELLFTSQSGAQPDVQDDTPPDTLF